MILAYYTTYNNTIKLENHDDIYFIDPIVPAEMNHELIDLIRCGEYVLLYGSRASGKSTRSLQAMEQLNSYGYICI